MNTLDLRQDTPWDTELMLPRITDNANLLELQILLGGPGGLQELADRLVATSLERGGTDNITAVLVKAD